MWDAIKHTLKDVIEPYSLVSRQILRLKFFCNPWLFKEWFGQMDGAFNVMSFLLLHLNVHL